MLSVIIPARDAAHTLPAQLAALAAQSYGGAWEVIVADNGSRDATASVARSWSNRLPLRVVHAGARRGCAHARNVGARGARGDFLLFVDADDIAHPTWLAAMARAAPCCDAIGGALDLDTLNAGVLMKGAQGTDRLPFLGFLPFPSGANCGLRSQLLADLGGFDETYRDGGDDVELFWRVQLSGYRLCFIDDAVVSYRERRSLGEIARRWYRFGRQDPHLYRDFSRSGMPREPELAAVRAWAQLVLRAPRYWRTWEGRRRWAAEAARRAGRVSGSIRYRRRYL